MTRTYAATVLNFFFPGAGYLLLGHKIPLAIAWLAGVLGLTYVEQVHSFGGETLQTADPTAFAVLFAAVFVMNTAFAVDAFQVGRAKMASATPSPA